MKHKIIILLTLISSNLFSQIKIFNDEFPDILLPHLSMDKEVSNAIKVASKSDNKKIALAEILKKMDQKPTLVLCWTFNNNTQDIVEPINAIYELSKSNDFQLILVNVNNNFNPSKPQIPAPIDMTSEFLNKLLVEYFPSWQTIPNYYGNLYEFNSYFGTNLDLFGIFLDNNKNVVNSHNLMTNVDFVKNYTQYIKENKFSKDTLYYQNQVRVAKAADASSYVLKKTNANHIDLTQYTIEGNQILAKMSYKNIASNPFFPERAIVADGKFSFYNTEGRLELEGDATDDFINNINYYQNNKIIFAIKDYNTINKALQVKSNEVISNLEDLSTYKRPLNNTTQSATISEYYENGNLKENYILNSIGQVISKQQGYENGKIKLKITQSEDLRYYDNGKLKSSNYYNTLGKLNGEQKTFFENSKPQVIENYENGKKNGVYIKYFENGQIAEKSTYVDGKRAEGSQEFFTTGKLKFIKTDEKKEYYYPNGQLFWTDYYDNSNRIEKMYNANGTLRGVIRFDNYGYVICPSEFYDKNGKQIKKPYKLNDLIDSLFDEEAFKVYLGRENQSEYDDDSLTDRMLKSMDEEEKRLFKESFKVKLNQLGYPDLIYCD
jgi:antitoxin component YwqK of YwqJK toxin-antitoxin module